MAGTNFDASRYVIFI